MICRADPLGEFRLPNGVPGYRLPTLFYLWLLLPADGAAIPWLFLVFATLAVGSAFAIGAQLGPARLASGYTVALITWWQCSGFSSSYLPVHRGLCRCW